MNSNTTPQVTIYSTSWCGFCHSLEQYLEQKKVAYVTKDIEKDESAYNELMEAIGGAGNFRGVPTSSINGEIVVGFDRPKIDSALAKNN
ncbi:NrdH-redoxin [Candidatus Saccharibacteria bacterium RIFCSPHIGHO2_12_FULL_42_8]|nr:MAG: NrdH-redoxin [Candidatus Saccharibacteria bacterium RIFCSPHIGHO2_12_FULL_42_8]